MQDDETIEEGSQRHREEHLKQLLLPLYQREDKEDENDQEKDDNSLLQPASIFEQQGGRNTPQ